VLAWTRNPLLLLGNRREYNQSETILLTTHNMEDGRRACDKRLAIIDHGRVIALGLRRSSRFRSRRLPPAPPLWPALPQIFCSVSKAWPAVREVRATDGDWH